MSGEGAVDKSERLDLMALATGALLVWLPLEDLVRKAVAGPLVIYLVKDLLILGAALPLLVRRERGGPPFPRAFGLVLAWGGVLYFLGSFNPRLPNYLIPLNGIHMAFFALPLLPVGMALSRRPSVVRRLLWALALGGAAAAMLGMVQAFVDPGFLNPEDPAGWQLRMVRGGDVQYVAGPFLSPGRYVAFLLGACAAATALYLSLEEAPRRRAAVVVVVLTVAGLLSSGARVTLFCVPFLLVTAWLLAAVSREEGANRALSGASANARRLFTLVLAGLVTVVAATLVSERVASILGFYWNDIFAERGEMLRSRAELHLGIGHLDLWTLVAGNGTGSASMGLHYIVPVGTLPWVEGGFASITSELGLLGLAFYLLLAGNVTLLFLGRRAAGGSRLGDALLAAFGPLVILQLWVMNILGPVLQQYTVAVPLWLFTGITWGLAATATTHRRAPR